MDERVRIESEFGGIRRDSVGESPGVAFAPWHGIEQALASLGLGMTFTIGAPATMLLIHVLWDSHFRDFTRLEIVLVAICGFIGGLIVLTSAVFGLIFGITAIMAGRRQNRPIALGIAGVLLCGFDILMWIFIMILWAFAIGSRI
jgi:hypothetical protein